LLAHLVSDGRQGKTLTIGEKAPTKTGDLIEKRGLKRCRDPSEASVRLDLPPLPWFQDVAREEATPSDERSSTALVVWKKGGDREEGQEKDEGGGQVKTGTVKKRQGDPWWKWVREDYMETDKVEKETYAAGGTKSTGSTTDPDMTTTQRNATPTKIGRARRGDTEMEPGPLTTREVVGEFKGEGGVYVGRGAPGHDRSKWANPFKIGVHGNRAGVLNLFREYAREAFGEDDLEELRGKVLLCH